ncbi:MAG: class I SAM-dependent methyltransferase [Deltaproteobacteria bacterium]|nr:class I SAM-dependent methyltransferase [Deltaproteobacteria bacterium]
MKLVRIDPPGTFCFYEAVFDMVDRLHARTFVEVGCGAGGLSYKLVERGLTGVGYDFSAEAVALATETLRPFIAARRYQLIHGDVWSIAASEEHVDLSLSMMVMEHIHDDVAFLQKLASLVRPGGHVLVAVPGRKEKWSVEDDTVGHLRRYDREDLIATFAKAQIENVEVWSVAVPTANLLFSLGNLMIRHSAETEKRQQSQRQQTETSGIREIPFKTVFPPFCKLLLNRVTLAPLFWLQRRFYHTRLGLTLLGVGTVK